MLDVTEQLQRYATALGDAVPSEPAVPPRRSGPVLAMAAAAAVVVAAGVWALIGTTGDETPVATQSGQHQLTVPTEGASPDLLDDGTPVWVVRHDDGSVSVLDAVSPHRPLGAGQLVGWCPTSSGFEDPMYGSLYDAHGRKRGGPAPSGLARYPITDIADGTVTVTGPPRRQSRQAEGGPAPSPPVGAHCFAGDGGYVAGYNPGTLELHPIRSQTPISPVDAIEQREGTVVVIEAPVVLVRGQTAVVCTTDVEDSTPPQCDGIAAPDLTLPHDEPWAVMNGRFIAHPTDGTLTALAYVGERQIDSPGR